MSATKRDEEQAMENLCSCSAIDIDIKIHEDNQGAIKMATNRFSSRRTRHVDVKHHIVRDAVEGEGVVQVGYVKSGEQHADVLTKALTSLRRR